MIPFVLTGSELSSNKVSSLRGVFIAKLMQRSETPRHSEAPKFFEYIYVMAIKSHHNSVKGKWNLLNDYTNYEHSSASFYELEIIKKHKPCDFRFI